MRCSRWLVTFLLLVPAYGAADSGGAESFAYFGVDQVTSGSPRSHLERLVELGFTGILLKVRDASRASEAERILAYARAARASGGEVLSGRQPGRLGRLEMGWRADASLPDRLCPPDAGYWLSIRSRFSGAMDVVHRAGSIDGLILDAEWYLPFNSRDCPNQGPNSAAEVAAALRGILSDRLEDFPPGRFSVGVLGAEHDWFSRGVLSGLTGSADRVYAFLEQSYSQGLSPGSCVSRRNSRALTRMSG
jgi:hypothetical protein